MNASIAHKASTESKYNEEASVRAQNTILALELMIDNYSGFGRNKITEYVHIEDIHVVQPYFIKNGFRCHYNIFNRNLTISWKF